MNATLRRTVQTAAVIGITAGAVCTVDAPPVCAPSSTIEIELREMDERLKRIIEKIREMHDDRR